MPGLNRPVVRPESEGTTVDKDFVVDGPVVDSELLLCHETVCVVVRISGQSLQPGKTRTGQQSPK